jgi:hypothetical protein
VRDAVLMSTGAVVGVWACSAVALRTNALKTASALFRIVMLSWWIGQ